MRWSSLVGLFAAIVGAGTACSLTTSLDGFSGGSMIVIAPEGGEAGADAAVDAPPESGPPVEAGMDARPNLHPAGRFEGPSCSPWGPYESTLEKVPVAHSGSGACRVCATPTADDFFTIDDQGIGPAIVGATYRAEAWVRAPPNQTAAPYAAVYLRSFSNIDGNFVDLDLERSTPTPISSTWQRFEVVMTVTKPGGTLNVFVGAQNVPNACFLVDDVVVHRVD